MVALKDIAAKVAAGVRLNEADALALFESPHLVEIGRLADDANRRRNGRQVFYNVNRHINPTNICALSCKFCAFSRKPGEEGAYAYDMEEIVRKAGEAVAQGATEVHMVGGLHPRWPFKHYRDIIATLRSTYPGLHLKAFTAVELDWMARRDRRSVKEVLADLVDAGLGSLPGGGAEIFHPTVRDAICDTKVSAEQWIDTHRMAHHLGLKSNCTMLYGHIESYEHRVDHMRRLRELQDETGGFNAFIPLSFQPFDNEMGINRYTFGYDDLKTIAVARLYLDNIPNIKAYWIMLGQDIAQLALHFGANDLDGTVTEEKISRMAGGRSGMALGRGYIEEMVRRAGRIPVERDTLYHPLNVPEEAYEPYSAMSRLPSELAAKVRARTITSLGDAESLAANATLLELAQGHTIKSAAGFALALNVTVDPAMPVSAATNAFADHWRAFKERHAQEPTTILLEAADGAFLDGALAYVRTLVKEVKLAAQGVTIAWRGLKSATNLAPQEVFLGLREAGVDVIQESSRDGRDTLALHEEAHRSDMPTQARLEVGESGCDRLFLTGALAWRQLQSKTHGLIGLSVELGSDQFLTPSEYLKALAMARLLCSNVPHIVAPLAKVPTMQPKRSGGSFTAVNQAPSLKLAPTLLHFGADDLGEVPLDEMSADALADEIASAGLSALARDARFSYTESFAGRRPITQHSPQALA